MGTKFTYALYLTVASAVFSLLLFFLGFQTEKLAVGQYLQWFGFVIMFAFLWLGIKAVREESPDKSLSYGQGVGAGTLISLFSGLMSAVYGYIHFKFINPSFLDYQMELLKTKWAEKGLSDAQIEQLETVSRKFSGPGMTAFFTPFAVVIVGLIMALIIAAFLKRSAAPTTEPPTT
jgi:hypothetical protein